MQTLNADKFFQVSVNSRNFGFIQTWGNNTKVSRCPKQEKCDSLVLSRSDLWIVWRCHGISRVYSYYFCLDPTVRKDAWIRTTSITVMVFFSKVGFWKLIDDSYVKSSFSIIENSIFKDTLQLNIFRKWIDLRAKSFIKTSVNMKQKSMKVYGKKSVVQKSKCALRRRFPLSKSRFTYFMRFFFSQT